jgi:DNA polymerase-3 subunit alpha
MTLQVNCHQHTEGSFLDGEARVGEVVDRAVALGMDYIAITDHGECNMHLAAAKAAAAAQIGFVPGLEGYWLAAEEVAWHREQKGVLRRPKPSHLCLLAMTNQGLSNLWALSSETYAPQYFDYKPIATPELLAKYAEGIWASDGCMMTQFAKAVHYGHEDQARQLLGILRHIYRDRFYMELHTWQFMNPRTDDKIPWSVWGENEVLSSATINARMTALNQAKVRFATEMGVPMVVVNDSHHATPEKWLNKEYVWAFNTSDDADKLRSSLQARAQKADHLMGEDEIHLWMAKHGIARDIVAEAIKNSHDIASQCEVQIRPTLSMPRLADSEVDDLKDLLKACEQGFQRYVVDEGLDQDRYMARLEEELRLIAAKHFAGYFNIVRDSAMAFRSGSWAQFVKKGTPKEPLLLGPGRGSAGGCLVAYLTGITLIDPLKYGTLFSRFLSPGRKGLPDIDMDLPQSQRPFALAYLRKRYGEDNVCAIGTVNRSGPRQTLRDLGRALEISIPEVNAMSFHIEEVERLRDPNDPDAGELTYAELIERKGHELARYARDYPELFQRMGELTGLARHSGVHPSGILISAEPILGRVPLRDSKTKGRTTQFDMYDVEALGGVKFDWLGLRHLDTISHARQLIYDRHGVWIDFDRTGLSVPAGCTSVETFSDDHFTDPAIWEQLADGQTLGIFQVETSNCTQACIEFKPQSHLDIANLTSIIRPGVADAGLKETYLRRRAALEPVIYDHPLMEQIVGPGWATNTYGVLVYQEQIMEAVRLLASFTADEADDVRKAVAKKQMELMAPLKEKFVGGCLANPAFVEFFGAPTSEDVGGEAPALPSLASPNRAVPSLAGPRLAMHEAVYQTIEKIWASIEAAGRYAFNFSHAIEYGSFISTWEIWLKYHYPQEFLVALMATDAKNINKYIREARRRKITILPPDINKSETKFSIEGEAIRYGIDTIRGVGPTAARDIKARRPYRSLEDYLAKAGTGSNKGAVYNLILIGAFDEMGTRVQMLNQLEQFRAREGLVPSTLLDDEKLAKIVARRLAHNPDKYRVPVPDFSDRETMYQIEKHLCGTYVTVDPLERYVAALDKIALRDPLDMANFTRGQTFYIGGQLTGIRPTTTKKGRNPGQEMAHLSVMWNEEEFRVVCFPEAWAATKLLLDVGAPVVLTVKRLDNGCSLEHVDRLDHFYNKNGLP